MWGSLFHLLPVALLDNNSILLSIISILESFYCPKRQSNIFLCSGVIIEAMSRFEVPEIGTQLQGKVVVLTGMY
jgi:hypothetical protein